MLFNFDSVFLKPFNAVDALCWTDLKDIILLFFRHLIIELGLATIFWKTLFSVISWSGGCSAGRERQMLDNEK